MDSANFVEVERQISFLWQFVTTDDTWLHQFQPEMKSELKSFSAFQEIEDSDVCRQGDCLYSRECKMSTAIGLPKKGHTITRDSVDKKGALQPEQCSGTHIRSVQAWLLGGFQLVKHHT